MTAARRHGAFVIFLPLNRNADLLPGSASQGHFAPSRNSAFQSRPEATDE